MIKTMQQQSELRRAKSKSTMSIKTPATVEQRLPWNDERLAGLGNDF